MKWNVCSCSEKHTYALLSSWPVFYYNEEGKSGQQPAWKILISWALQPDFTRFPAPRTGNAVSGLWISEECSLKGACTCVKKRTCWKKRQTAWRSLKRK